MHAHSLKFIFLALLLTSFVKAEQPANLAISGFDAVSYFTEDKPLPGDSRYQTEWQGQLWYFSSSQNLALFQKQPAGYAPRFDGHCANGLSDGHLIMADPKIYRIIDGQLYLFYSWWGKAQWAVNQQEQIQLADYWWAEFSEQAIIY